MLNKMITDEGSRVRQEESVEIICEIVYQTNPINLCKITKKWSFEPFTQACIRALVEDRRIIPLTNASASPPMEDNASVIPPIEDIINEDGILSLVLSSLRIRDAARTCALSSRWRFLWTHFRNLTFDAAEMFDDHTVKLIYSDDTPLTLSDKINVLMEKTDLFIRSVDSVVQQLQGQLFPVAEFVVRYFLHQVHSHQLDEWVRFAVSSKTKILALHLQKQFFYDYEADFDGEKYGFPCHLLESSSVEELILSSCSLKYPSHFGCLSHLKVLRLYLVDVTEEDITRLMSNSYTLECLKLHLIPNLVNLRISRPQNRLQTFIAKYCYHLRGEIMINAVNLKNLGYDGYPVNFVFRQSSQLLEVYIRFETVENEPSLEYYLNKLSNNLPQVRALFCAMAGSSKVPNLHVQCNYFVNLKYLEWSWEVGDQKMSRHHLATLLDASPLLVQLNLRLRSRLPFEKVPKRLRKLRKKLPEHPHAFLSRIIFFNFQWDKWHVEFLMYLVKNAVELKKLMITNLEGFDEKSWNKLQREVPADVELFISLDNYS